MQIYFDVSDERTAEMTIEDYEAIERAQDGDVRMYRMRPLMARFMTDADGQPLAHSVAMKRLGALPVTDMGDVIEAFTRAFMNAALPKANATASGPPSGTVDPSPDGGQR